MSHLLRHLVVPAHTNKESKPELQFLTNCVNFINILSPSTNERERKINKVVQLNFKNISFFISAYCSRRSYCAIFSEIILKSRSSLYKKL